jgi:hypothetical protein
MVNIPGAYHGDYMLNHRLSWSQGHQGRPTISSETRVEIQHVVLESLRQWLSVLFRVRSLRHDSQTLAETATMGRVRCRSATEGLQTRHPVALLDQAAVCSAVINLISHHSMSIRL